MAFPNDKETWEDVETDDLIVKEHPNGIWDFLERLQDTLGINFLGGFGSLKLRLDDLKNIVTTKKVKALDTDGLKLKNTSEQGIEISNAGNVTIDKDLEVTDRASIYGDVTINGFVELTNKITSGLFLKENGRIDQAKKTGIVGADEVVDQLGGGVGDSCLWHYVVKNGTNFRAGTIQAVWDGTNIETIETHTADIGDTSPLTLAVAYHDVEIELQASASSGTWEVIVTHFII